MAIEFYMPALSLLDDNARALAGGKIYFYASGTSTPLEVYKDDALTTAWTQPITLNAAGRPTNQIFLQARDYKVVIKNASDIQVGPPMDPVHGGISAEDVAIDIDGVSANVHVWINDKLGNIFDYIPSSIDHDDIRAGAETSDLSSYIATAYGSRPLLEWGDGVFYTSESVDLTSLDGGALVGCGANFGPTYDLDGGSGTRIIVTGSNIPGVRLMNASTLRDVAIRYQTEQAAANTAAIGVELNNWNRGHIDNLLVSGAAISVGVPQSNAPGKPYNSYWNSKIGTIASYNASLGHFDLRPYNAGVTNVVIDNLNLNGAGSVDDFTTPGKSCTYGVKALNLSGLKIGQINLESLTLTGPALDVSSGRNTFSIDQLRMETVSFEAASGTPILKFGGSYNRSRIEGVDIQYVRWKPSGSAPGSGDSLYIIQTNATINQIFVPIYLRSTCDFGGTGTRRVLTNSCSDFTASDIEIPYYDEGSQLSDGSWTDSVTTRQSPVRKIGGYAAYEKFRSGRNTNYLTRYYANSAPAAADGTFSAGDEWQIRAPSAGAVSKYRCTTAGVVGSGGAFTATETVPLVGTATFDPSSLTTGTQTSVQTMTVTGAILGMKVARKSFSLDLQGCALEAYVSATNTVSYFIRNGTAGTVDLASGTVTVEVVP